MRTTVISTLKETRNNSNESSEMGPWVKFSRQNFPGRPSLNSCLHSVGRSSYVTDGLIQH